MSKKAASRRRSVRDLQRMLSLMQAPSLKVSKIDVALMGDGPYYPFAYHVLCGALLARLADLGAGREIPDLRKTMGMAVAASGFLSAPDGEIAYTGRSMGESWVAAMNAYAGRRAHNSAGAWLSSVSLGYLLRNYSSSRWGIVLIPAMTSDMHTALGELDGYAAAVPYTGLTLMGLSWAAGVRVSRGSGWHQQTAVIGKKDSDRVGVLHAPGVWASIRGGSPIDNSGTGGRLAPGMIHLKVQNQQGAWKDILAGRSKTLLIGSQLGPSLLSLSQPVNLFNSSVSLSGHNLLLRGEYRPSLKSPTQGVADLELSATSCGVKIMINPVASKQLILRMLVPGDDAHLSEDRLSFVWSSGTATAAAVSDTTLSPAPPTASYPKTKLLVFTGKEGEPLEIVVRGNDCLVYQKRGPRLSPEASW